jgi:hypothetical protein
MASLVNALRETAASRATVPPISAVMAAVMPWSRRRMPSGQIGVGDLGEIKNAREGFPPGELLR